MTIHFPSAPAVFVTAMASLLLAASVWAIPFQIATGLAATGVIATLWTRNYRLSRLLAWVQVSLIIIGWGLAQHPFILPPSLTITEAAAPASVLFPVVIGLGAGMVFLIPAFWYLYRVFKG